MKKRNTIQRQLVLQAVNTLPTHPTAEEVYEEIKKSYPDISLTTVYRNLNLLVEEGVINKIALGGSADRYDCCCEPHCHVECISCQRFSNVDGKGLQEIDDDITTQTGYVIKKHNLIFKGICPNCQAKKAD